MDHALEFGLASDHLREARRAVLGREPKPDRAWIRQIKAVEVAARPVIAENDDEAHLGRVLGELKAQSDMWSVRPDPGHAERGNLTPAGRRRSNSWAGSSGTTTSGMATVPLVMCSRRQRMRRPSS